MFNEMGVFNRYSVTLKFLRSYSVRSCFKTHHLCLYQNLKFVEATNGKTSAYLQLKTLSVLNCKQNFSTKSGKIYQETENEYAHFVMENSRDYMRSIVKFPLKIGDSREAAEQLNSFNKFAKVTSDNYNGSSLENEKFSCLVKDVCFSLPGASDDEIQRTLHCLCMWPPTAKTFTPNFKALWNALDQECVKRLKNWDVSRKLLIADYWFCLRLSRITQFNRELIMDMFKICESLTSQQFVQLMFYANLQREFPSISMPNLEKKFESVIHFVSIEELGIICLAYFKTKSKIFRADVIQSVIKKLITNLETVNTVTVAAILKFLRKSLNLSLIDTYISTLHKCMPFIKNWDVPTSVHLALLSSECNVYHPLLLDNVSDKLATKMTQSRIKDCVKLLQCLAHFNHFYENKFHDAVLNEINKTERQKEVNSYPKDLVCLTLYYAYMGHFNYEVLSKIFHNKFYKLCSSSYSDILPAFAEIYYCVEIEYKTYSGPKLDQLNRKILETRRGNLPSSTMHQNMQTRLIASVYECLVQTLGSDENVLIRHVLPHVYSPDIIVRLQTKSISPLREICHGFPSDVVLVVPKDEVWACFVVCGAFSFAYRSKQITGVTAMKLRQLQKLGYHVIFIPFFDLPQNSSSRENFIKEKLRSLEGKYFK